MYFDIDEMWPIFVVIGCLIFIPIALFNMKRAEESIRQTSKEIEESCKLNGRTLIVYKQSPILAKILKIKPHKVDMVKYNPEEIHFGAVTVGGVTSGGVYKTGGDYSVKSLADGRYKILYYLDDVEITHIALASDLAKKAKNSPIGKYLEGERIEVIKDVPLSDATIQLMRMGYNNETTMNFASVDKAAGYPSLEKCEAIVKWLGNA